MRRGKEGKGEERVTDAQEILLSFGTLYIQASPADCFCRFRGSLQKVMRVSASPLPPSLPAGYLSEISPTLLPSMDLSFMCVCVLRAYVSFSFSDVSFLCHVPPRLLLSDLCRFLLAVFPHLLGRTLLFLTSDPRSRIPDTTTPPFPSDPYH